MDADGMAGRIMLVVDAALPTSAQEACAALAGALAEQAAMPVTVATVPIEVLDRLRPAVEQAEGARTREIAPPPGAGSGGAMSAAPFVWRDDGRPDWGAMWTTFCELALYGGPPQRGPASRLRGPATPGAGAAPAIADEMLAELRRGIWETTRLYAEAAGPGWLAVTCDSPTMAAWLCATIILENVDARLDEDRLLLPAGPGYRLDDEVKSIITVLAKTHHYWQEHLAGEGRIALDGA
jgi:hypothetical protein